MRTAALKPGDRVKCNVRGLEFEATVENPRPRPHYVKVKDPHPSWVTYKFLTARQVTERLSRKRGRRRG